MLVELHGVEVGSSLRLSDSLFVVMHFVVFRSFLSSSSHVSLCLWVSLSFLVSSVHLCVCIPSSHLVIFSLVKLTGSLQCLSPLVRPLGEAPATARAAALRNA